MNPKRIIHKPTLKVGSEWARILRVPILEPTGWDNTEDYTVKPVSKIEFCNRAANSKLEVKPELSRRDAAKYGQRKLAIPK